MPTTLTVNRNRTGRPVGYSDRTTLDADGVYEVEYRATLGWFTVTMRRDGYQPDERP
jgi:hypothetical protein